MFADILDHSQRESLLHLLVEVANADGVIKGEELEVIRRYALSLGFGEDKVTQALGSRFTEEEAILQAYPLEVRKVLLMETMTLVMIDEDYAAEEEKLIRQIAERLGLESATAQRIHQHVQAGFDWNRAGLALIQGEE